MRKLFNLKARKLIMVKRRLVPKQKLAIMIAALVVISLTVFFFFELENKRQETEYTAIYQKDDEYTGFVQYNLTVNNHQQIDFEQKCLILGGTGFLLICAWAWFSYDMRKVKPLAFLSAAILLLVNAAFDYKTLNEISSFKWSFSSVLYLSFVGAGLGVLFILLLLSFVSVLQMLESATEEAQTITQPVKHLKRR